MDHNQVLVQDFSGKNYFLRLELIEPGEPVGFFSHPQKLATACCSLSNYKHITTFQREILTNTSGAIAKLNFKFE